MNLLTEEINKIKSIMGLLNVVPNEVIFDDDTDKPVEDGELGEQGTAGGTTSSSGGGGSKPAYPTVTKWETGLTRGVANSVDPSSRWSQLYNIKRGKANTLL